jgi:hypothetical protein
MVNALRKSEAGRYVEIVMIEVVAVSQGSELVKQRKIEQPPCRNYPDKAALQSSVS